MTYRLCLPVTVGCRELILTMALLFASSAIASADLRKVWQGQNERREFVQEGAGFSFEYDGSVTGPIFSKVWRESESGTIVTLSHASGLLVTREVRALPEFGAVEYKLTFKNVSRGVLPPIARVNALDLAFNNATSDEICVTSSGGGLADFFLPPRTFAIRENCFAPTVVNAGGSLELTTEGGRSSNKDLPFFFVQNKTRRDGIFIALGWSGQWRATVTHNAQWSPLVPSMPSARGRLTITGGIPDLSIELKPGEEISGPTILVGLYKGMVTDGANRLRRLIRDAYTPKLSGREVLPMAVFGPYWNVGPDFDEALLKQQVDAAAQIGQEYFTLDAGWFAGAGKAFSGFSTGLGNWDQVDRDKLPNGLGAMASYARSKGLKFGLWFEPERVAPGSHLANAHPDWVLWKREEWLGTESSEWNRGYGVLNYGLPQVQEWARNMLDRHIREYGLRLIKHDFNIDPLQYWVANDSPNRRGLTQLRHIQGLYAVIDWLRERHPNVVFDGCAAGGRRIDLETARRFHTFSISDNNVDPAIMRFHLFGINYFLPGNYHKLEYTLPLPHDTRFQADDLGFQSIFGGAAGAGGRADLWPLEMKRRARQHFDTWKSLRRYLMEDYYPLSGQPRDVETWSGWQFHDPSDQSGFVQTFRTKTIDAKHRFIVYGMDMQAQYLFSDVYSTETIEMSGGDAMTKGLEVAQAPMSSRVFTYRRKADALRTSQ